MSSIRGEGVGKTSRRVWEPNGLKSRERLKTEKIGHEKLVL